MTPLDNWIVATLELRSGGQMVSELVERCPKELAAGHTRACRSARITARLILLEEHGQVQRHDTRKPVIWCLR